MSSLIALLPPWSSAVQGCDSRGHGSRPGALREETTGTHRADGQDRESLTAALTCRTDPETSGLWFLGK